MWAREGRGWIARVCKGLDPILLVWILLFAYGARKFLTQDPLEARHRPWKGPHITADGWYYYHNLRSLMIDHDLDLTNEYRDFGNWYGYKRSPETGRPHNPFGIGPALFWAPGFAVGHWIASIQNSPEPHKRPTGYSPIEQLLALSISFLAGFAALLLCFGIARKYAGPTPALLGAIAAGLGGPLIWYSIYEPAMPHALSAFTTALFLYLALPLRRRRSCLDGLILGGILGSAMLVKPDQITLALIPGVEAIRNIWIDRHKGWSKLSGHVTAGSIILLAASLLVLPQLFAWKTVYGHFLIVPQGPGFMRWRESMWSEVLFSSRNGLLSSSPLLWFGAVGLLFLIRRDSVSGVLLAASFALQVFVSGAAWDWWAGGAYGGRRLTGCTPILAVGLATLIAAVLHAPKVRWRFAVRKGLVVLGVVIFLNFQLKFLRAYRDKDISWNTTESFVDRLRTVTGWRLGPWYKWTGYPFSFPANWFFALRYGVRPSQYDLSVGTYLLQECVGPNTPPRPHDSVDFAAPTSQAFLGRHVERSGGVAVIDRGGGELLIPLNRPGEFDLRLRPAEKISSQRRFAFNGTPLVLLAPRPNSSELMLHVPGALVRRGINVLSMATDHRVKVEGMTVDEGREWPAPWRAHFP